MNPLIHPLRDGDPKSFQGWTIKGLIGEGGQSTIYLAEKNGELAALKVIRKEFLGNQTSVERFFTEIKNLEMLSHPNIARVIEVEDSGKFLAIEYIDGLNLEEFVEVNGPFDFAEWLNLAESLAKTLEYYQGKGIIHKDISPRNIVIGPNGPVVIDFGISYLEKDPRLTAMEETVGTPPYMSPEHFGLTRPKEMDNFSLAGTLIFAATGHLPFAGSNSSEWKESILFSRPDLSGLTDFQVQVLTPLLYKQPVDRGTLSVFIKLLNEFQLKGSGSKLISKDLVKVKQESRHKLTQEMKQLTFRRATFKKIASVAFIVLLMSIGIVSYGIIRIQDSTSTLSTNSTKGGETDLGSIEASPAASASPNQESSSPSSSRDCETEYDKKGENVLSKCLPVAAKGDLTSIFYVGVTYFEKKNYKEAEKWLLLGAKGKDLNSTRYLIETYTQLSNTVERDRWTKICADTSYGETNTSPLKDIAYCKMMHGFVLTKAGATKEAILYLTDAADYGSGDAAAWLGIYYRDLDQRNNAIKWLTKAAELGSSNGLSALISYADEIGDDALAKKWLLVSANDGNQVNMGVLALVYYFDKDFSSAKKWAIKGASFGDVLSIYVQGAVAYDQGQKTEGKELITKAANKGNISAMRKLGNIYRIDEKNYNEASIWYEKLAARNDFTGTAIYSSLLLLTGKDQESCVYNDKVLELGNQAKKNGTYDAAVMDQFMIEAKKTYDSWCSKLYTNN